jgi:hypothetical protein
MLVPPAPQLLRQLQQQRAAALLQPVTTRLSALETQLLQVLLLLLLGPGVCWDG